MFEFVSRRKSGRAPFSPCGRRWPSEARSDEGAPGAEQNAAEIAVAAPPPHPALRATFSRKGRRAGPARAAFLIRGCFPFLGLFAAPALAADLNDYPTAARADYVFACMKANGDTRQSLDQCSCSIDVIASILPYDRYVAGETVASLSQQAGQIGGMMRNMTSAKDAQNDLRRAQAEAQIRCF
jgi:hypothetical protein